MDTKVLNEIVNNQSKQLRELSEEVAKQVMLPLNEANLEEDDLRVLHARLKELFMSNFSFVSSLILMNSIASKKVDKI